MKLLELTGIKAIKNKNPLEILQWIKDNIAAGKTNLRFLGRGSHGVALTDGTTVYKFWHRDSAYEEFYNFAKHLDFDCLPKFKSHIKYLPFSFKSKTLGRFLDEYEKYKEDYEKEFDIDDLDPDSEEYQAWEDAASKYVTNEGFYYVKMEKLDPVSGYIEVFAEDHPLHGISIDVFDLIGLFRAYKFGASDATIRESIFNEVETEIISYIDDNSLNIDFEILRDEFIDDSEGIHEDLGDILDVMDRLTMMADDENLSLDLHDENFAMRGSKLVILDPFFNAADLDLARSVLKLRNFAV